MPPKQCPSCGRFLKNAFVDDLDAAAAPCPGCGDELCADLFASTVVSELVSEDAGADPEDSDALAVVADAVSDTDHISVRPPDLEPASVRDDNRDVLAGWDATAGPEEIASWQLDRRPFPTDTVVVVGGGVLGAIAGGLVGQTRDPRRTGVGTVGGLSLGLSVAAAARRIWRLS